MFDSLKLSIIIKLCVQIGDNIIHNLTVTDFQVKS